MVKHPWPLLEISLSDFRRLATLNINTYGYLENMECGLLEWTGVEWNGVEWSGVDWSGMERTGVEWSGIMEYWNPGMGYWNNMEYWNGIEYWIGLISRLCSYCCSY